MLVQFVNQPAMTVPMTEGKTKIDSMMQMAQQQIRQQYI